MRILRFFLPLALLMLVIGCGGGGTANNDDGTPYGLRFNNLRGRVRSCIVSEYDGNVVATSTRYDYSPEGLMTRKTVYGRDDSTVTAYIYDSKFRIKDVQSDEVRHYESRYKHGRLESEYFFTDDERTSGWMRTFGYDSIGRIVRQASIAIGRTDSTVRMYSYASTNYPSGMTLKKPDGSCTEQTCDTMGMVVTERLYRRTGRLRRRESIAYAYDKQGNWTEARRTWHGRTVAYSTASYSYYPEDVHAVPSIGVDADADTEQPRSMNVPGVPLTIFICVATVAFLFLYLIYAEKRWALFHDVTGEVLPNGMKRMWMYNPQPYVKMGILSGSLFGAFLSTILLILMFGALVWLLFWMVKILLWAIIIIGVLLAFVGIFLLIARDSRGFAALVSGCVISAFRDTFKSWGNILVECGERVLADLNVIDWTMSIFQTYGITMLLCIVLPLGCFLALALLLITLSLVLRGTEYVAMMIYGVNRPCPFCGNKKGIAYMVDGKEYPVDLNPGVYGVFHQTCRSIGVRVPTMLLNGKAKLTRRCPHCGRLINKSHEQVVGTDVHIGIVGERSSGKSYMLYSALDGLQRMFGSDLTQVAVDGNTDVAVFAERIRQRDGIQTAVRNRYKAVEMVLRRKYHPFPYHLFFYDVAGEKFNVKSVSGTSAMDFYKNVRSIVFVIDPTMVDVSRLSPSGRFMDWLTDKGMMSVEKYDIESTLAALVRILSMVGRKTNDIDVTLAFSKSDLGYLADLGFGDDPSADMLRAFMRSDMGLYNADNTITDSFKSVDYVSFSAVDADKTHLCSVFLNVLRQRGVRTDN